jgi:predicted transcriptional regulator
MKDTTITIRFETPLKERVEAMAKTERRTLAAQAAYLMEKGLKVLEQGKSAESSSIQTGETA